MAPRISCSRLASNPTLKHPGHLGVAALLVSRCNLPGTEVALHVEAAQREKERIRTDNIILLLRVVARTTQ